jgi:hypothetical protein
MTRRWRVRYWPAWLAIAACALTAITISLGKPLTRWEDYAWIGSQAVWALSWRDARRQHEHCRDNLKKATGAAEFYQQISAEKWDRT